MKRQERFPGFEHSPLEIKKFVFASGIFWIMLSSGKIVHYKPEDITKFKNWLANHDIEEIHAKNDKLK